MGRECKASHDEKLNVLFEKRLQNVSLIRGQGIRVRQCTIPFD